MNTDEVNAYRGYRQAVELCRAVAADDGPAAEAMLDTEVAADRVRELVSGLASVAVSLARTVNYHQPDITVDALWTAMATHGEQQIFQAVVNDLPDATGGENDD